MIYQKTLHQHTSLKYFHHWPPKFDQDIIISKPFFAAHNWCYCLHFLFTLGIISKPGAWGWMNVTYIDLDDSSKYKYRVQMCVGSSFFLNVFVIPVLTTILTYGSFKTIGLSTFVSIWPTATDYCTVYVGGQGLVRKVYSEMGSNYEICDGGSSLCVTGAALRL